MDFSDKTEAEDFAGSLSAAPLPDAGLSALLADGMNPAGYFIYMLWESRSDAAPAYIGSSKNVLARLGQHLGGNCLTTRRLKVGWVSLVKCATETRMLGREKELIMRYQPRLNVHHKSETKTTANY